MEKENRTFCPLDRKNAGDTILKGSIGEMEQRILKRLQGPEFNEQFLIADLDFNQERWFTNYSGDISGRFLEIMSLAGKSDPDYHSALSFMLKKVPENQRDAGHFGIPVDWSQPIDYEKPTADGSRPPVPRMMPILWGSSRIFTGLIEAYLSFGDEKMLACARKLGDFYLHTEEELASSLRVEEYRATGTYAAGYATCYFPGMEGLVRLYEVTGEEKYLRQAQKMADFRQEYQFDRLPIEHTHGYLCCVYSLLLIYKESREKKWLVMAEKNWKDLVEGGYVMPGGGLLEKGIPGFNRDEGCSQADWLRVNLLFFELTGDAVYLDMAERVLHNQLKINQCETGGFGHRRVLYDEFGVAGYGTYDEEALWCCDFHGAMTLQNLKKYVLMEEKDKSFVYIPFLFDFEAETGELSVRIEEMKAPSGHRRWKIETRVNAEEKRSIAIRIPDWAGLISLYDGEGNALTVEKERNMLYISTGKEGAAYICDIICPVYMEDRHFHKLCPEQAAEEKGFVLRQGSDLLAVRNGEKEPVILERLADDREAVYIFRCLPSAVKSSQSGQVQ